MQDALLPGDYLLVNRTAFWFFEPQRGDIIAFKYPLQDNTKNPFKLLYEVYLKLKGVDIPIRRHLIKRIIAIPGDEILIREDEVYINGRELNEPYLKTDLMEDYGPVRVPDDAYFVMGDNRVVSRDSRIWGFVDRELLIGKVSMVYYSYIPGKCPTPDCQGKPVCMKNKVTKEEGVYYKCPICDEVWRDYYDYRERNWWGFVNAIRWSRLGRLVR